MGRIPRARETLLLLAGVPPIEIDELCKKCARKRGHSTTRYTSFMTSLTTREMAPAIEKKPGTLEYAYLYVEFSSIRTGP